MLKLNPELEQALTALIGAVTMPAFPRGDYESRRAMTTEGLSAALETDAELHVEDFSYTATDGHEIILRWYKRVGSTSTAATLYTHGGGKIAGSLASHDAACRYYAAHTDLGVLAVDFRLSPEYPFPIPHEDAYGGLVWLHDNADKLGVDRDKIAVTGDSGGGGIAAGVVHAARDRNGPKVAKQVLIYPMLDDRNMEPDPLLEPFALWNYDDNYTGWSCYLGDAFGSDDVSPYAAPVRDTNFADLPPTFIDCGELDIFRDECMVYASQLMKAGISVDLHIYPGLSHGFDVCMAKSEPGQVAWEARFRALRELNN